MTLGRLIREAREKFGIKQSDLAKKIGISASHLSDIENDNRMPNFDLTCLIIDVLGLDVNFVYDLGMKSYVKEKKIRPYKGLERKERGSPDLG